MNTFENDWTREVDRLRSENKSPKIDYDVRGEELYEARKQRDRLRAENKVLLEALDLIWDFSAKQFEANSDERALWAKVNRIASAAIAAVERKEP